MISRVKTEELESIAKELSAATNDLESEVNSLFTRFANVPTITKEWVGTQANFYFSKISEDKRYYSDLVGSLRSLAQKINNNASDVYASIKTNNTRK